MATDSPGAVNGTAIEAALAEELARQGVEADVAALAAAVEMALNQPPADEGKRPEELNATNDD
jgi:hypothetical protein